MVAQYTAKELLTRLGEAIRHNIEAADLLGVKLIPANLITIVNANLLVMKQNFPGILPDDGKMIVETCGNDCNCPTVIYDEVFTQILYPEEEKQPIYIDGNNTLQ